MKKIKFLVVALIAFFAFGINANAKNELYDINMDIYIDNNGDALINEKWNVNATSGTEMYHPYFNLGNSYISDFNVSEGEILYQSVDSWDVEDSFFDKTYKNGIHAISDGIELCWGISSYGQHTYNLSYKINNFIYKTSDGYQMLYWTLMPSGMSPTPLNVTITIHADSYFSDSLEMYGYGKDDTKIEISNGSIIMTTNNDTLYSDEYMTLLVKFPGNTFNIIDNTLDNDFQYYLDMSKRDFGNILIYVVLAVIVCIGLFFLILWCKSAEIYNYVGKRKMIFGSSGKKLINKYEYFRDLPCNKDIFRAYWVAEAYNLNKRRTDFLGVILLKWIREKNVTLERKEKGLIYKKDQVSIVLNKGVNISNYLEQKLYQMMYEASNDGVLESREFEKWCRKNYYKISDWFYDVLDEESDKLEKEGKLKLTNVTRYKIFKYEVYEIDDSMKEEAEQFAGLKRFLENFSSIGEKYPIDVFLWEYYLMYAQILGISEQVIKDFKKIYPNEISDITISNVNFVSNISSASISNSSSSGGGGGSFGGGGSGGGIR